MRIATLCRSTCNLPLCKSIIVSGAATYVRRGAQRGRVGGFEGLPERREHGEQYRIQPGDTLSEIARQYSVSEQAIRSVNALNGDRIVVGQVLKIPRS